MVYKAKFATSHEWQAKSKLDIVVESANCNKSSFHPCRQGDNLCGACFVSFEVDSVLLRQQGLSDYLLSIDAAVATVSSIEFFLLTLWYWNKKNCFLIFCKHTKFMKTSIVIIIQLYARKVYKGKKNGGIKLKKNTICIFYLTFFAQYSVYWISLWLGFDPRRIFFFSCRWAM